MEYKACSFTGHRQIKEEHLPQLPSLLARAIAYAYDSGVRTFYSGGAYGFDMLAAREVLRFRVSHRDVSLVLLLPCPEQADSWSEWTRDSYEYILSEADEVVYVSQTYKSDCMRRRNAQLAARADILIAYVSHMRSGSGQTVNFAKHYGKTVYNLYPALDAKSEQK